VAENQTLLEASIQNKTPLPHACGVGQCGSCKMKIIKGSAAPMSQVVCGITEQELANEFILACQCQPSSDMKVKTL